MGSSSCTHEARVAELEVLATLAGFTADVRFQWRLRPDVARVCPGNGAVFVGDAKQTEDPKCAATQRRLRWYATALCSLPDDVLVTVALAVPGDADVAGWARCLVRSVTPSMVCETPTLLSIGATVVVTTRASPARSGRGSAYRDRPWPAAKNDVLCAPSTSSAAGAV